MMTELHIISQPDFISRGRGEVLCSKHRNVLRISGRSAIVAGRALPVRLLGHSLACGRCRRRGEAMAIRQVRASKRSPMGLYVIQVIGGRENTVQQLVASRASDLITECFAPRCELRKRYNGEWKTVKELLFPGYLFVDTTDVEALFRRLKEVPAFTRLLGNERDRFVPLDREEVAWIESLTTSQTRVLQMSEGVIEGDRVIVTKGPLKGHEALISKIDRHKRLAYLDLCILGRRKTIRVGIEIVARLKTYLDR